MKRTLLPLILAVSGLVLNNWASSMPLFEWQVGSLSENYPSNYGVHLSPSPWIARLGESLVDNVYTSRNVVVSFDGKPCLIDKINIEWSVIDKKLDLISGKLKKSSLWVVLASYILIVLSIIYMWWMIIWQEHRTIAEAVSLTIIILFFFYFRLLDRKLSIDYFFAWCNEYPGIVSFNAEISKIHYEMLIIMLSAILAEFGALGIMIRQIAKTFIERKSSIESAVG